MDTLISSLFVLLLDLLGRLINVGGFVYFCAFLGSLAVRFYAEGRQDDFGYAVAYLILACLYTKRPFVTLLRWCSSLYQTVKSKTRNAIKLGP